MSNKFFLFRSFYHVLRKKNDTKLKFLLYFSWTVVGIFCATCTVTGYPCSDKKWFLEGFAYKRWHGSLNTFSKCIFGQFTKQDFQTILNRFFAGSPNGSCIFKNCLFSHIISFTLDVLKVCACTSRLMVF